MLEDLKKQAKERLEPRNLNAIPLEPNLTVIVDTYDKVNITCGEHELDVFYEIDKTIGRGCVPDGEYILRLDYGDESFDEDIIVEGDTIYKP